MVRADPPHADIRPTAAARLALLTFPTALTPSACGSISPSGPVRVSRAAEASISTGEPAEARRPAEHEQVVHPELLHHLALDPAAHRL